MDIKCIIEKITTDNKIEIIYINENVDIYKDEIPDHCGIYILTTNSGKNYIGSSINIKNRIKKHIINFKEPIINLAVYLTEEKKDAVLLEKNLIILTKPDLNIVGKYPKIEEIEEIENNKIKIINVKDCKKPVINLRYKDSLCHKNKNKCYRCEGFKKCKIFALKQECLTH